MLTRLSILSMCFLSALCAGGRVDSRLLALSYDAAQGGVRPLYGAPGAAQFGAVLAADEPLSWVAGTPRLDFILARSLSSSELRRYQYQAGALIRVPWPGAPAAPDQLALSPRGTAGALYYVSENAVRLLDRFDTFGLPATPEILAVSDDSSTVLAVAGDATYLWSADEGLRRIFEAEHVTAAAFVPGSTDVLLADSRRGAVLRVRHGAVESLVALDDIAAPAALAAIDGSRAFLVAAGKLYVFDLAARSFSAIDCPCQPAMLAPAGASLFQLGTSDGRLWLLDASASRPRTVFVQEASHE